MHEGSGIATEALMEKYLGLPTALGRSTDEQFEGIVSSLKKLCKGWTPQLLNSAGREVLVKSVGQAITTFSMSCFRLSKDVCKKITSVLARYWWGGDEKKRKMHWKKWIDIAIPKSEGGMGFRDIQIFNQAMLAKQGWRLVTNPDSLCARLLKGKYFHDCGFMEARNKRNASHTWWAILHGREALKKGLIKRVGDGNTIKIWEDPWVPESHDKRTLVKLPTTTVTLVEELVDQDNGGWDMQKLEANFVEPDVSMIARIPMGRAEEDFWSWFPDRFGNFSVRSCYKLMIERRRDVEAA